MPIGLYLISKIYRLGYRSVQIKLISCSHKNYFSVCLPFCLTAGLMRRKGLVATH